MIIKDEVLQLCEELEEYSCIFTTFWAQIDNICETSNIPTLAVTLSNIGDPISLLINPDFWNSIDKNTKKFAIIHECLHVFFEHSTLFNNNIYSKDAATLKKLNIATDITINHYIDNVIKFDRNLISWQNYCWVETVFNKTVPNYKNAEHYYNLLSHRSTNLNKTLINDHNGLRNNNIQNDTEEGIKDIIYNSIQKAIDQEDNTAKDLSQNHNIGNVAGKMSSTQCKDIYAKKIESNIWKDLMNSCRKSKIRTSKEDIDFSESWIKENRRSTSLNSTLILPKEIEDIVEVNPVSISIYLDVSASCEVYAQSFVELVKNIPKNKFKFEVFTFDTKIRPLDIKPNVVGIPYGGGTAFKPIVDHINNNTPNKKDLFLIFTDGFGNSTNSVIEHSKYRWLLTKNSSMTDINNMNDSSKFKKPIILPF